MEKDEELKNKLMDEIKKKEVWADQELYKEIRRIISLKTDDITMDERLDKLIRNIPNIIASFKDCNDEEEYRMLAKRSDGTLATIQVRDKKTGFQVYSPITLNSYEYKKFYFETLAYCVITYVMFFKDVEFQIMSNDVARGGILTITDSSLPHLLGLEAKLVSGKDSALMERIIPGYNSLGILEKIMCIIQNNDKIIQYELDNEIDIFNYYKNMQKNKDFLMLGRFFSHNDENAQDKNNIILLSNSDNQFCLYKKSNMNQQMNRNLCKMIIQQLDTGEYFPRSLQAVSNEMLEGFNVFEFLSRGSHNIVLDGEDCEINCQPQGIYGYLLSVVNTNNVRSYMYNTLFYTNQITDEKINQIINLIRSMNGDESLLNEILSSFILSANINNLNLYERFLGMYIDAVTPEDLQNIDLLLEQEKYEEIDMIVKKHILDIINNKGFKKFDTDVDNFFDNQKDEILAISNRGLIVEEMEPKLLELYYLLILINEYVNELNIDEREILYHEIQMAVYRYKSLSLKASSKKR